MSKNFQNYLLLLCLLSNVALSLLENIGFIFRSSGFASGNPVAGYTMQSSLGFISRIFSFLLVPAIAWLADTGSVHLSLQIICAYYVSLLAGLYLCCRFESVIVAKLSSVIFAVQETGSILGIFKWSKIALLILNAFTLRRMPNKTSSLNRQMSSLLSRNDRRVILLFSCSYIPYYSAWIVVCILLEIIPQKPAFCISLVSFLTFSCTLVQALIFDPYLASLADNEVQSLAIYSKLINSKFAAAFYSSIASIALFLYFVKRET